MRDRKSHFVSVRWAAWAAILFLCRSNLPRFDARIWRHFHVKTCGHASALSQFGMSTALFNL